MKNNFFTNRLLLILSILLLCIFALSTSVFGADVVSYDYYDAEIGQNIIIQVPSDLVSNDYRFFVVRTPIQSTSNGDYVGFYLYYSKSEMFKDGVNVSSAKGIGDWGVGCYLNSSASVYFGNQTLGNPSSTTTTIANSSFSVVYSNFDLYRDSSKTELVFQVPPQVPEITQALVNQATQVGMKPLEEIKMILPIVIVTIVGLIAFLIGLRFLLKQLRKA